MSEKSSESRLNGGSSTSTPEQASASEASNESILSTRSAMFDVELERELVRSASEYTRLTANIIAARDDMNVASALFFHPALQQKMAEFTRARLRQLAQLPEPTNVPFAFWEAFRQAIKSVKNSQPLIYQDREDFFKRLWMYFDFQVRNRRRRQGKSRGRESLDREVPIDQVAVESSAGPVETVELRDELRQVFDCLKSADLNDHERELLKQVFLLGRPLQDYADEHGISPGTASKWKASALSKLRRCVEKRSNQ